jgi:hypothetical protein
MLGEYADRYKIESWQIFVQNQRNQILYTVISPEIIEWTKNPSHATDPLNRRICTYTSTCSITLTDMAEKLTIY